MAEIVISVVGKIGEYTVAPIGRQFGYLFGYNGNIEGLSILVAELERKRVGVQQQVDVAYRNCETIRPNVDNWLKRVNQKKEEAGSILEENENIGKGCLNEWCLNLKSRYWLSRKAAKKTRDLAVFLDEGEFQRVSDPAPPPGYAASVPNLQIEGSSSSGALESRLLIMRQVMEAVKDNKILVIGIWGMGGVGKTTMVKEVEKKAREEHMFDEFATSVVSQKPDLKKIQRDISDFLGLRFEEESLFARAARLRKRLTQEGSNGKPKRILIILDDLWEWINLVEVGIPYGGSDHNCKIVLTSQSKDVCDQMKTNVNFPVQVLPEKEARILFWNTVDYSFYATTDLHRIAEDIVKECGGLPIAITTIARALTNKRETTWIDVLRQLKNPEFDGVNAKVFNTLKVSYDFLETKEIKDLFLLCCLFAEDFDISIEDLVRYGMGLRLFQSSDKLYVARAIAYEHVQKLLDSNLLLGSDMKGFVRMHDLVRDFALWITSKVEHAFGHVFMVKFGYQLKEWPIKDTYEHYTSISLECDEMHELPDWLKCPNLKLLQLVKSQPFSILKFPENFYEGMEKLQVVASRRMFNPSLPRSLKLLTNLRTLSLDDCRFMDDISMIGNLVNLEILSLVHSDIKELPGEVGKLTRLKLLDLKWCEKLCRIVPGVLPRLIRLEELYMMGSSFSWAEQAYVHDRTNASFDELKQLTNLVAIEIDIPYEVLPISLPLKKLENFKISIAHRGGKLSYFHPVVENSLTLTADRSVLLGGVINVLWRRTDILYLKVKDLKNLPNKLEQEGFLKLRRLTFESCNELVSIINPSSNLEDICGGQHSKRNFNIPSSSMHQPAPFGKLQDLNLWGCNKLKSIFPVCIARGLIELKSLDIRQCQMMQEIFFKERGDENEKTVGKIEFPHLNRLHLEGLPKLIGFCKAVEEVELPQLEYLEFSGLPKLTSLYTETLALELPQPSHHFFNKKVKLNKVTNLKVSGMKKLIEILWPAQLPDHSISELRSIKVDDCERLLNVFPSNVIEGLHNLEFLQVKNCGSVVVIFDLQGLNNHELEVLSRLKQINLDDLPNLKHVCKTGCRGFQNLTSLNVERCERLETVFSVSIARCLVTLQSLRIVKCQIMESILSNESGEDENGAAVPPYKIEFPNLKRLLLQDLPNLVCFSKSADEVELPQLHNWVIVNVPKFAGLYPETITLASDRQNASPKNPF